MVWPWLRQDCKLLSSLHPNQYGGCYITEIFDRSAFFIGNTISFNVMNFITKDG